MCGSVCVRSHSVIPWQTDILVLPASLAVGFNCHLRNTLVFVYIHTHSVSGEKIFQFSFQSPISSFAERPDGGQTRLQPSISPAILEIAPDFLLKPP